MLRQKFIALAGILLTMTLYFWGHNVGSSSLILQGGILTITRISGEIGLVCLLMALAGGIGRRALSVVNFDAISIGERVVIDTTVGLGIISLLAVTMGLIGQFNWMIWGIIVVTSLIFSRDLFSWLRDMRELIFQSGRPATPWERFVRSFLIVALVSALLFALAPPFAWDAINYHLVIPQHYIDNNTISQNLDNHFFGFPQNMEMLYGLLMMFGSDRAPAVLHFMLALFALIGIYNLVRRHASSKAASVSVLLIMASLNIWILSSWSYVDLALMTYGTVAIIAIHQWTQVEKDKHHWLAITAILASIAAGIKYTSAPMIIALYLLIFLREPKNIVRNTLIFGGFGVLLFLPWLVKGTLLYENPVYPYIFDGANWDSIRSANFGESGKGLIGQGLGVHVPFLPLAATFFGLNKVTPYSFTTGAFLLTFPLLLLIGWQQLPDESKKLARNLLPLTIVTLIFWMVLAGLSGIGGQTRLMLIAIPLPAILGGLAYHSMENWQRRPIDIVFITQAAMIFSVLFGIFDYVNYFADSRVLEYHAGTISEDAYLTENMGILYDAMLELENLPDESRILFLWEPKTYYCPDNMTCTGDLLFDNWARPLQNGMSPEALIEQWQNDYDYALLFDFNQNGQKDGYSSWSAYHEFAIEQNSLFPQYFFDSMTEIWSDDVAYTLYQWE